MSAHARHRARHRPRHRKPLGAKRQRPARRYSAAAGVALLGAGVIAVTAAAPPPVQSQQSHQIRVASADVRLAAASGSLLNVPMNLLNDFINIPSTEVAGLDFLSKSMFFSGPWFVVSATNLWGVDPGDPSHFQSVVQLAIPIAALSGLGLPQSDTNGLGQQVWQLVATLLPISSACDAQSCPPNVPTSPITGITSVDSLIWLGQILSGQEKFPLIDNWLDLSRVFAALTPGGYTFGPTYPGYTDPSGPVNSIGGWFPGTTGPDNTNPWAGTTFSLDLTKPLNNYFNHLLADPSTNPIKLPDLETFGRTLQALTASLIVAFDPFTPGSPFCPGDCGFIKDMHLDYPDLVRGIGNLWPGNTTINTWLNAYDTGTANVPTPEQIQRSIEILQQGFWDFGNPSPPADWSKGFNLSSLAAGFHSFWSSLGVTLPDLNTTTVDPFADDPSSLASGPQSLMKAKVIEKDPESAQVSGESTPADESGAAKLSVDPAGTTPPVDTKPVDTKPVDTKPVDTKPVDTKPVDTKPVDTKPVDNKPSENKPSENKPSENKPSENKPSENKPSENKPSDTKPKDTKPSENKPSENKPSGGEHSGGAAA